MVSKDKCGTCPYEDCDYDSVEACPHVSGVQAEKLSEYEGTNSYQVAYYWQNRDKIRAYKQVHDKKNRVRINEYMRNYRKENNVKFNETRGRYRERNRERINANARRIYHEKKQLKGESNERESQKPTN